MQDPARRPTAEELLQHDFLQRVQAPISLQRVISAHAARRPPLDQHSHQVADYQQTMPRWNFGTESAAPEGQAHSRKAGTLRSHQINMTFKDDGTVRHTTIPRHPSLAMMAQLAQAGLVSTPQHYCTLISVFCMHQKSPSSQHASHSLSDRVYCSSAVGGGIFSILSFGDDDGFIMMVMMKCLQAMNGSRSAELSGSDAVLDSGESHDLASEVQPTPADDADRSQEDQHAAAAEPALPDCRSSPEAAAEQQGRAGGEAVQHRAATWQQSEGSMQEVASTSGSSESGPLYSPFHHCPAYCPPCSLNQS